MPANRENSMAGVLDASRHELLETGTRNPLVHVNRERRGASRLNVINGHSAAVFGILRRDGKRMRFKAMGRDDAEADDGMASAPPDPDSLAGTDRLADNPVETPFGPEASARRSPRLAGGTAVEEERGLDVPYPVQGFPRRRGRASSEVRRGGPPVLLPVRSERRQRRRDDQEQPVAHGNHFPARAAMPVGGVWCSQFRHFPPREAAAERMAGERPNRRHGVRAHRPAGFSPSG